MLGPVRKFAPFSPMTIASPTGVGVTVAVDVAVGAGVSVMVADAVTVGDNVFVDVPVSVCSAVIVARTVGVLDSVGKTISVGSTMLSAGPGWQAATQSITIRIRRRLCSKMFFPSTTFFISRIIGVMSDFIVISMTFAYLTASV